MSQSLLLATTLLLLATLIACSESNQTPVARFTIASPHPSDSVDEGENFSIVYLGRNVAEVTLQLDASSSTDPEEDSVRYLWDFGDGTTSENAVVRHVFPVSQSNEQVVIQLTVTDSKGASHRISKRIVFVVGASPLLAE